MLMIRTVSRCHLVRRPFAWIPWNEALLGTFWPAHPWPFAAENLAVHCSLERMKCLRLILCCLDSTWKLLNVAIIGRREDAGVK